MPAEAPLLPYARDEASTSQHISPYPHSAYEYDNPLSPSSGDDDSLAEHTRAGLQYWASKRHRNNAKGKGKAEDEYVGWRLKSRLKTINAGMFICLNIGVDPPDVVKTNPCAKLECWVDPTALPSTKAIEAIGRNLSQQFETLNPKVKYKTVLDPSIEETKKRCIELRKYAKDERTLFYYNGHGVPKPTPSGEIWVFNKNYTQYIPVSLYDLQEWLGSPCIYIWECSGAGNILANFGKQAERKDAEARAASQNGNSSHPTSDLPGSSYSDAIHLAACDANQILPMSPDLPADLFTSCLTSPIETSLRHFVLQDPLKRSVNPGDSRSRITVDMVMKIPGDLKDRRTPLGELNWIFTAVTDTIAWSFFSRETFNRLFRQDLLIAALFRNFLLAQRIMSVYHCTPISTPAIPSTHNHPLWNSWDLAVDACLAQLPDLLDLEAQREAGLSNSPPLSTYIPSTFFAQHLQAFEVWLEHGGSASRRLTPKQSNGMIARPLPQQLPTVLQVLLSQAHRLRALILLSRFVDLGPWAVHLSLAIGIFPYVQKLLQSPAVELKPVLIFIWARILAVDKTCQVDLLRDSAYNYFVQVLSPYPINGVHIVIPNANEHRAMCAFILSILCRNCRPGQAACMANGVFDLCMARLGEEDWLLKTWCLLCIAQLWADNDEGKALFMQTQRQEQLIHQLKDSAVEVRAAALYAFGTLLGASAGGESKSGGGGTGSQLSLNESMQQQIEAGVAFASIMSVKEDASPMVRKELVVVISCVVREWRGWMVAAAWVYYEQEGILSGDLKAEKDVVGQALLDWRAMGAKTKDEKQQCLTLLSSFKIVFETLLDLSVDPSTEVALMASTVVDYIVALLLDSAFTKVKGSATSRLFASQNQKKTLGRIPSGIERQQSKPPTLTRTNTETSTNGSLKRNNSVANALRSLASITGILPPQSPDSVTTQPDPLESLPAPSPGIASYRSPYPDASHERIQEDRPHPSRVVSRARVASHLSMSISSTQPPDPYQPPVNPASILQALTDEDMERLRIRRSKGGQAGGDADGRFGNNGLARGGDLGLGMVAKEVKDDVLPLKSGFYDSAMEYYREPQMKAPDGDEPGSETYNLQTWRFSRNEQLVDQSRQNEEFAAFNPWSTDAGTLHNDAWPLQLAFHSYDPVIAVTDDSDNICVWDWKNQVKMNKFSNQNVLGSSISSLHFINEMSSSLILTASTEGSVRIWRNCDIPDEVELASTFRAVSDVHPVGHSSGVLTSWEQNKGHLLVGGDMKVIRLWDATVERHLRDIATQAGANLTALASDQVKGNVFVAGFGDGVVRLFDKRNERSEKMAWRTWRKHHTWIQSVHMPTGQEYIILSASMNGEVRIWDSRAGGDTPLYESVAQSQGLMGMAVHNSTPVFATTSAPVGHSTRQKLVIEGYSVPEHPFPLSTINIPLAPAYHGNTPTRPAGFMPSAASLVFHPTEMVIAAGGFDASGMVRMYKCPTPDVPIVTSWEQSLQSVGYM